MYSFAVKKKINRTVAAMVCLNDGRVTGYNIPYYCVCLNELYN